MRQHSNVDPGSVHVANAVAAERMQPSLHIAGARPLGAGKMRHQFGVPIVFLDCDDGERWLLHARSLDTRRDPVNAHDVATGTIRVQETGASEEGLRL